MPITLAAMLLWFLVMIPLLRDRVKYYMERPPDGGRNRLARPVLSLSRLTVCSICSVVHSG
jgi:hypothetical protein